VAAGRVFGELLRRHRLTAGYSQEGLAERARLSAAAISALEQGVRRAPYRGTVRALIDALGGDEGVCSELEDAAACARGRRRTADSGFPAELTTFVDRNETDELVPLLADRRLVTITGTGGVGKTRIAVEVARRSAHRYDEAWFVDLVPIRESSGVAALLAARLNVPVTGRAGLDGVLRHLRSRRVLLVVDNCEHVIDGAASVVGHLLHESAATTVLATSRERLGVSSELAFRLPSMDPRTASRLFVMRACAADRNWSADPARTAVVEDICRRLDGLPLAIELAASRLPALGLDTLRRRLAGGIALSGGRDLPDRHQTMTATIAWSYDLLGDDERRLLRRLSVFAGVFTFEAAEELCGDDALPRTAVGDALARLVQKSLLDAEHVETSIRYSMLAAIRAFARDRLVESVGETVGIVAGARVAGQPMLAACR